MSKHAKHWNCAAAFVDMFVPKLFPGKYRYYKELDYTPSALINNPAAFTAMAARHAGVSK